jgi:TolA-binding protein
MARSVTSLETLGSRVAEALDERHALERRHAMEKARERFLGSITQAPRRKSRAVPLLAAAVTMMAVAASIFILVMRLNRPLAFTVDEGAGAAQSWLAAPRERPLAVRFSDGTLVRIESSSRARVVDVDRHGAHIALETGAIHADVVHTNASRWLLNAGPFTIRVTGTRFDLAWDSAAERFAIAVLEGSVMVSGSIVGPERAVAAGQALRVWVRQGRLDWTDDNQAAHEPSNAGAETIATAPAAPTETMASEPAPSDVHRSSDAAGGRAAISWRTWAHRGDLRRAFAAADALGFTAECAMATAPELLLLGDAARLSERPDRAVEALTALRRRYPRDPRRAAAAFALGKVAFDQRQAYREASEWFSTCLLEQPDGPLAREAAGRRIESLRNAGELDAAKTAAREYLVRYPDGPHVGLARSLR